MPSIVDRPAQRYVFESKTVSIPDFPAIADRIPEIIRTLAQKDIPVVGPPFFRYRVIHPGMRFTVEAGVPIPDGLDGPKPMQTGELPAGKYVLETYIGPPSGLASATDAVLTWGAAEGIRWDSTETADGQAWGCRLEVLHTNPLEQPDPAKWVTDLLFRTA